MISIEKYTLHLETNKFLWIWKNLHRLRSRLGKRLRDFIWFAPPHMPNIYAKIYFRRDSSQKITEWIAFLALELYSRGASNPSDIKSK